MTDTSRHLTDGELVRCLDEPGAAGAERVRIHLAGCEACGARLGAMEELFAALRSDPPAATDAELAAQRERILAAVETRPRPSVGIPSRRAMRALPRWAVWAPITAAAAIAALVLWAPRGTRSPGVATGPVADLPTAETAPADPGKAMLPALTEASRAAEEIVAAAGDAALAESLIAAPPLDAAIPDGTLVSADEWTELEEAFAALPAGDREAILDELASTSFDL